MKSAIKELNKQEVEGALKVSFQLDKTRYLSQDYLLEVIPTLRKTETTSHDKCIELWSIINELNQEKDYLIMINNNQYKIATEEEAEEYLKDYFISKIAPKLNRYWSMKKKLKLNGQGDIFNENEFKDCYLRFEKGE